MVQHLRIVFEPKLENKNVERSLHHLHTMSTINDNFKKTELFSEAYFLTYM